MWGPYAIACICLYGGAWQWKERTTATEYQSKLNVCMHLQPPGKYLYLTGWGSLMITILGYRLLSWTVFYVHERFLRIYKVAPDKLSKRLKLWKKTHTHTYIYIAYERAHTHTLTSQTCSCPSHGRKIKVPGVCKTSPKEPRAHTPTLIELPSSNSHTQSLSCFFILANSSESAQGNVANFSKKLI